MERRKNPDTEEACCDHFRSFCDIVEDMDPQSMCSMMLMESSYQQAIEMCNKKSPKSSIHCGEQNPF